MAGHADVAAVGMSEGWGPWYSSPSGHRLRARFGGHVLPLPASARCFLRQPGLVFPEEVPSGPSVR